MSEIMKPCTKCGHIPYVVPVTCGHQIEDDWRQYDPNEEIAIKIEYCIECACGFRTNRHSTKEEAISEWNKLCDHYLHYPWEYGRDQTAKADKGKAQIHYVPPQIILDIAEVREYGVAKYQDPENWKRVEIERYIDAIGRHYIAMLYDPLSVDEESGLAHYKHIACNVAFLCELLKEAER